MLSRKIGPSKLNAKSKAWPVLLGSLFLLAIGMFLLQIIGTVSTGKPPILVLPPAQPGVETPVVVDTEPPVAVKKEDPAPEVPSKEPGSKCDFAPACALESSGQYEAAFKLYEEMMDTCGEEGWTTLKVLGVGMSGRARLLRTPCGLQIAAKEPPQGGNSIGSFTMLKNHIEVDCMVMKYLTPFRAQCNNCFPEYYYFSPKTGVCYNEFINSTSFTKHVLQQNTSTPAGIEALKKDFLQSLDALEVLKSQNMVHRDLQAQNILIRNEAPTQLVIMDFCWINWASVPHKFDTTGRKLGRFTRTPDWKTHGEEDTYAFACAVADILFFPISNPLYKNKDSDALKYRDYCLPDMARTRQDTTSLEYVIWRMTQGAHADRLHDIDEMRALVKGVTHLVDTSAPV